MRICYVFLLLFSLIHVSIAQTKSGDKKGHNLSKNSSKSGPDLVGLITVTPEFTHGPTPITVLIDVVETKKVSTSGVITVYIQKQSSFVDLRFDPAASSIGESKVNNQNWSFDDTTNPNYYVLTSTKVIAGGALSTIGLTGTFKSNVSGRLGLSMTILKGSGGEINSTNNVASTPITYSPQ